MKPKLLVLELWGVGDLALATPFLQAARAHFTVTLLAKPVAATLQPRFWPDVQVVPFVAPFTAFQKKYRFWQWPWSEIGAVVRQLRSERFDFAVAGRWNPFENFLLRLTGAPVRIGFPRIGSEVFLTRSLRPRVLDAHRHDDWRLVAQALGFELPPRSCLPSAPRASRTLVLHTGAAQPVRVWPLARYHELAQRARHAGWAVRIVCDSAQRDGWRQLGEAPVTPASLEDLLELFTTAGAFLGNDSGPGHLAAISGVPTFTVFGPQRPEWFAPLHPAAAWIEGKPCPYKPCFDSCRFATPHCLRDLTTAEVWPRLEAFLQECPVV